MNLMQWSLLVLPFLAVAQPKQLITSARSEAVRSGSESATQRGGQTDDADRPAVLGEYLNSLPLFGERAKTAAQIDEEIHFLNDCDRNFASRPEASEFFASRGWDYVASGQLDTAAHRFNLSWLLDKQNADAYWGLGVVCYQKNHLPDAIRMLKRGLDVADSNVVLMTDLATVQLKYYQQKPKADVLKEAEKHLQRAVSMGPASATPYQKLSLVSFLRADYAKAWAYFHQARSLDVSALDLVYLNELLAKQPDPKGIFR